VDPAPDQPVDARRLEQAIGDPEGEYDAARANAGAAGELDLDRSVRAAGRGDGARADQ
jgi:hypothetical protein